eukprot:6193816-Pleurochrysis_carterae.AAC.2
MPRIDHAQGQQSASERRYRCLVSAAAVLPNASIAVASAATATVLAVAAVAVVVAAAAVATATSFAIACAAWVDSPNSYETSAISSHRRRISSDTSCSQEDSV